MGLSLSGVRTESCPLFQPPVWMPLASPATPARKRRGRLACQPHLAWLFALQGANQNLSAFSTARLDAARISRDPSSKRHSTALSSYSTLVPLLVHANTTNTLL